jgi:hypothetical protein
MRPQQSALQHWLKVYPKCPLTMPSACSSTWVLLDAPGSYLCILGGHIPLQLRQLLMRLKHLAALHIAARLEASAG